MLRLGAARAWPVAGRNTQLLSHWLTPPRAPHVAPASPQQRQTHSYQGHQGLQTAVCSQQGQHSLQEGAQPSQHVALIDASYYCFRFHHAFAALSRRNAPNARLQSGGPHSEDTAILHMFLKFVLELVVDALKHRVRQEPSNCDSPFGAPTSLVVVFDSVRDPEAVHVRRALYPDYKMNRSESEVPGELAKALTELPGVLAHMGVKCIGLPNVEADDLIATLAAHYSGSSSSSSSCVTIYSADKDFKQLLGERVCMVSHLPQGTRSHTLASFTEQFQFQPRFFPDFQALAGDKSDNVSGVPGVGEKTAKPLIQTHATIENLYTALHTLKPSARVGRLKEAGVRDVLLLRSLFELQKSVRAPDGAQLHACLPFGGGDRLLHEVNRGEVEAYCDRYKLKQVLGLFEEACGILGKAVQG